MNIDQSNRSKRNKEGPIKKAYHFYMRQIGLISKFFRKRNMDLIGDSIVSFLGEPQHLIRIAHYTLIGNVPLDEFHHHDMNPPHLSYFDQPEVATLLIHGAGGNQGPWIPFAKVLKEKGVGPVFTMNVKRVSTAFRYHKNVQQEEHEAVRERLRQIKQLYIDQGLRPPKIVVVGFSRGGDLGLSVCDEDKDIIKVIRIGKVTAGDELNEKCIEKLFEIVGKYDAICHWRSYLPEEFQYEVLTGHLGLIFSREAQEKVAEIINNLN